MAKRQKRTATNPGKEATAARRRVRAVHAQAESLHERSRRRYKEAEATHAKVHSIEEESRRQAESPEAKPKPPRLGILQTETREKGTPVAPATLGRPPEARLPFSVVGVGASAGGYEAFVNLLNRLPRRIGMAIVLIQHLDPSHLRELLAQATRIPVIEIKNGKELLPDHVYVMPSNVVVTVEDGRFRVCQRSAHGPSMPVDIFFRSLALEQQNRAIGILLSGTGTDGTLGMQEIKGEGGMTFAQDHGTAKYFGMPGSAIAAGAIDFVMTPEEIAGELARLSVHPYVSPQRPGEPLYPIAAEPHNAETLFRDASDELRALFVLLRSRTGVDFSLYKAGTLNRRIMRRMVLHKIDSLAAYVKFLQQTAVEVDSLFNDLLISVTGFFRDPQSFEILQKKILPRLLRARPNNAPLRVWSCGCSTGEEAYSLAMVISEFLEKQKRIIPIQIFASDLDERGIERARAGVYHENILLDVSPERLQHFFVKIDGRYQVAKSIRDLCVFARQNILIDPPFSNLDLISCRNVLIYLTPVLQRRVIPLFHFALKPNGILMLGGSESISESLNLFEPLDRKNKIYVRKATPYRPTVEIGRFSPAQPRQPAAPPRPADGALSLSVQDKVDQIILSRCAPSGVVVNARMDVLQFRGQTADYLQHQQGAASLNLLNMAREYLALDLRRAVHQAVKRGERIEHRASRVALPGGRLSDLIVEVHPFSAGSSEQLFLVLFRPVPSPEPEGRAVNARKSVSGRQSSQLDQELAETKEFLQAVIEEQEATNEELKSANEEVRSSNEELQSTNEELETAREDMQSTNEELTTLNQELQNRNAELAHLNNDLTNVLNHVNTAVIILGRDLSIRRFTAAAERSFNFIPSDVGRRLSDLARNINVRGLEEICHDVIDNLTTVEREVQDTQGRWFSLRVRPYCTRENRIDGVVLMLIDIEEVRRAMVQMIGIVRHPLLLLYEDLTVSRANEAFCRLFQVSLAETENRRLYDLGNGQWNIPGLRQLLEEILPKRSEVQDFVVEHDFPKIGHRKISVNAQRFHAETCGVQRIAVAFEDITAAQPAP